MAPGPPQTSPRAAIHDRPERFFVQEGSTNYWTCTQCPARIMIYFTCDASDRDRLEHRRDTFSDHLRQHLDTLPTDRDEFNRMADAFGAAATSPMESPDAYVTNTLNAFFMHDHAQGFIDCRLCEVRFDPTGYGPGFVELRRAFIEHLRENHSNALHEYNTRDRHMEDIQRAPAHDRIVRAGASRGVESIPPSPADTAEAIRRSHAWLKRHWPKWKYLRYRLTGVVQMRGPSGDRYLIKSNALFHAYASSAYGTRIDKLCIDPLGVHSSDRIASLVHGIQNNESAFLRTANRLCTAVTDTPLNCIHLKTVWNTAQFRFIISSEEQSNENQ